MRLLAGFGLLLALLGSHPAQARSIQIVHGDRDRRGPWSVRSADGRYELRLEERAPTARDGTLTLLDGAKPLWHRRWPMVGLVAMVSNTGKVVVPDYAERGTVTVLGAEGLAEGTLVLPKDWRPSGAASSLDGEVLVLGTDPPGSRVMIRVDLAAHTASRGVLGALSGPVPLGVQPGETRSEVEMQDRETLVSECNRGEAAPNEVSAVVLQAAPDVQAQRVSQLQSCLPEALLRKLAEQPAELVSVNLAVLSALRLHLPSEAGPFAQKLARRLPREQPERRQVLLAVMQAGVSDPELIDEAANAPSPDARSAALTALAAQKPSAAGMDLLFPKRGDSPSVEQAKHHAVLAWLAAPSPEHAAMLDRVVELSRQGQVTPWPGLEVVLIGVALRKGDVADAESRLGPATSALGYAQLPPGSVEEELRAEVLLTNASMYRRDVPPGDPVSMRIEESIVRGLQTLVNSTTKVCAPKATRLVAPCKARPAGVVAKEQLRRLGVKPETSSKR